jgi:predicted secreted protein
MREAKYLEPESNSSEIMFGAAGTETIYFTADEVGTATLTLDYKRGWETDISPRRPLP